MSDPRYVIIPGRALTDRQVREVHLRVLCWLGRHTSRNGWCYLNQKRAGLALGFSRETISRAISRLVELGYVDKRRQQRRDGGNNICLYRVLMDWGEPSQEAFKFPDPERQSPEAEEGQPKPPPSDPPVTGGCDANRVTGGCDANRVTGGCDPQGSQLNVLGNKRSIHTHTPDTRPESGGSGNSVECVVTRLDHLDLSPGQRRVAKLFIAPLTRALELRSKHTVELLADMALELTRYPTRILELAMSQLRRSRSVFPTIAQADQVCREVWQQSRRQVEIEKGTSKWHAWRTHAEQAGQRYQLRLMDQQQKITVDGDLLDDLMAATPSGPAGEASPRDTTPATDSSQARENDSAPPCGEARPTGRRASRAPAEGRAGRPEQPVSERTSSC